MEEIMNIILKYNDSAYNVDTIKKHQEVINTEENVVWGIIKPAENSPGMSSAKIKEINKQVNNNMKTYAFMATSGRITHVGSIKRIIDRDEIENFTKIIPGYYHKDLFRSVAGVMMDKITEVPEDILDKLKRYGTEDGDVAVGNQTNPLYVSCKEKLDINFFEEDILETKLRNSLDQVLNNYLTAKANESFAGHELGDLLRHQVPEILKDYIRNFSLNNNSNYLIKGSIGQGNWAYVPWIAIMDEDITTTTQEGVYVVYLFSEDMSKLYLTFNQGVTNTSSQEIEEIKIELRDNLDIKDFKADNNVYLTDNTNNIAKQYESSTIAYVEYDQNDLSKERTLIKDLQRVLKIYSEYKTKYIDTPNVEVQNQLSDQEIIETIQAYINSKGFIYPEGLIENFYLSLKTKPFVLLAGISGTGKTKLVELFAESIGCNNVNDRFNIIPVRPDWNDGSDLLGYKNIKDKFNPGPMIKIIKNAIDSPDKVYMLCLDEMNLARVEYYFSDLLSIMETRKRKNGRIETDQLLKDTDFVREEDKQKYSELYLPDNLYLVGTVNMDETTHPFSKKVLDRANTIEFSEVNLDSFDLDQIEQEPLDSVGNSFLRSDYINLNDCSMEDREFIKRVIEELIKINEILKTENLHVGYRIRDEIVFYMLYNRQEGLISFEEAFDFQLMQKILPRIQGSSYLIKNILIDLFKLTTGRDFSKEEIRIGDKLINYIEGNVSILYSRSARKLAYMIKRFEEDGFTAYWL